MKTTVELPDALMAEARDLAKRKGWTVKVVLEESLRAFLDKEKSAPPTTPFVWNPVTVKGQGLQNPNLTFAEILEMSERPFPGTPDQYE